MKALVFDQKKIGIVEDDFEISQTYEQFLKLHGYADIFVANNGEDIVHAANNGHGTFDIVIMDYRLPGMNGLQAARELTRRNPKTKIIMASGDTSIEGQTRSAGFNFIEKPFSMSSLIELVNSAISDSPIETKT